ncbi:hypothetical protein DL96DRAFT_1720310 [Flagelloscypha sp. PMI_526]|nr:hypothetical protein DL96DRAFT_1720310 [Flagelloscypha sp. PMI_526]
MATDESLTIADPIVASTVGRPNVQNDEFTLPTSSPAFAVQPDDIQGWQALRLTIVSAIALYSKLYNISDTQVRAVIGTIDLGSAADEDLPIGENVPIGDNMDGPYAAPYAYSSGPFHAGVLYAIIPSGPLLYNHALAAKGTYHVVTRGLAVGITNAINGSRAIAGVSDHGRQKRSTLKGAIEFFNAALAAGQVKIVEKRV